MVICELAGDVARRVGRPKRLMLNIPAFIASPVFLGPVGLPALDSDTATDNAANNNAGRPALAWCPFFHALNWFRRSFNRHRWSWSLKSLQPVHIHDPPVPKDDESPDKYPPSFDCGFGASFGASVTIPRVFSWWCIRRIAVA